MSIPKMGVKIMDNNIRIKTGMQPAHSKPLKSSGQVINPYPDVIKKKLKKKETKGEFQFGNSGFTTK